MARIARSKFYRWRKRSSRGNCVKMNTFEMNIREIFEDPHQPVLEHRIGSGLFGQEYIKAYMAWYKHIGVPLTMMPYIKDQHGKFVNQDGSEISRDSMRER